MNRILSAVRRHLAGSRGQRLAVFVAGALLFLPVIVAVRKAQTDYGVHASIAQAWLDAGRPLASHFLFHLLSIVAAFLVPGLGLGRAGVLVGVAASALLCVILFETVKRCPVPGTSSARRVAATAAIALSLAIVAPINLLTAHEQNLYFGYTSPIAYHNPTITLLKPLALLTFLGLVQALRSRTLHLPGLLGLAVLTVVGTLAKPSYTVCALPAGAAIVALWRLAGWPVQWRGAALGCALPAIAVLAWQYAYTYGAATGAGLVFAPFQVVEASSSWLVPKFLLSVAFPVCVYALHARRAVRRLDLNLAWVAFLVATAYGYLLAESGERALAGNWLWCGQVTLFLLFVTSLTFLLRQVPAGGTPGRRPGPRFLACAGVYALHVVCGLAFYALHTTSVSRSWW